MTRLALLLALLTIAATPARAQETEPPDGTKINSTQVSGTDVSRFSPGLREEIGKLAGTPLNRQTLRDLAARMEAEQPRYVAAVRVLADPDGGAKVVFVVARIREHGNDANINNRYVVEDVENGACPNATSTRRCWRICARSPAGRSIRTRSSAWKRGCGTRSPTISCHDRPPERANRAASSSSSL